MLKFPEIELNGAYNIITGKIFTGGCIFPATHFVKTNASYAAFSTPRERAEDAQKYRPSPWKFRDYSLRPRHVNYNRITHRIPRCTARHKILRETFHELCLSRRDIVSRSIE